MLLVYAQEPIPDLSPSIFLAGPTPRTLETQSWRAEAIRLLAEQRFGARTGGMVLIPEPADGVWQEHYDAQIDWETEGLERATCILFWIPRDMATMPGLTTNDEFGFWKASGKVVLGTPPEAVKVRYQRRYAEKYGIPLANTLADTVAAALKMLRG